MYRVLGYSTVYCTQSGRGSIFFQNTKVTCILLYNKGGGGGPEGTQITKVCTNVHTCMYICHLAPPPPAPNVIYEISCNDCNGQTNRPLIKRIKEQESHSRLHLRNPDDFSHNQSAPAHHSRTTGHKIAWDRTTILTTTRYKTQLDLTEHRAIKTRNPSLNRTDSAHTCSKLWDPIIPKIACTIKPRPGGISFLKK